MRFPMIKLAIIITLLMTLCAGCQGQAESALPMAFARSVSLSTYNAASTDSPIYTNDLIAFKIGLVQDVQDFSRAYDSLLTKLEIDPGDGVGWLDLSAEYMASVSTQSPFGSYPLQNPGDYSIQARATFWDGEVVYADPITITVLPAEE